MVLGGRVAAGLASATRLVVNCTVHKIRTGITRRDLPERYGPYKTGYWAASGRRALRHHSDRAVGMLERGVRHTTEGQCERRVASRGAEDE
jgi:transposase